MRQRHSSSEAPTRRLPVVGALVSIPLVLMLLASAGAVGAVEDAEQALVLGADGTAARELVAVGRDLVIHGTVLGNAAVLQGNALVSGSVRGDLVVLEGDALLHGDARIGGDLVVLGGELEAADTSRVEGRILVYPTASRALLALAEVPSLGGRAVLLSARLGLLLAWWLAGTLLMAVFARSLVRTGAVAGARPLSSFVVGLSLLCAAALGLILLAGVAPALVSLPLLVLVVLAAFTFKVWGTVALIAAFGAWLGGRFARRLDPLGRYLLGLAVLGGVKLLPWVGAVAWSAVTLVGIGATLIHLRSVAAAD